MLGTKSLRALRCSQRLSNAPACKRIKIACENSFLRWYPSSSHFRRLASWDACRLLLSLYSRLKREKNIRKGISGLQATWSDSIHLQLLLGCFTLVSNLPFSISTSVNNFCRIFVPPIVQRFYNIHACFSLLNIQPGQLFIRPKLFGESPCFEYHPLRQTSEVLCKMSKSATKSGHISQLLTFAKQFLQNPLIVINVMFWTKSLRALRCSQRLRNAPAFICSMILTGISMVQWW